MFRYMEAIILRENHYSGNYLDRLNPMGIWNINKGIMNMKTMTVICFIVLFNLVFAAIASAETKLLNARTGEHETFTRIVLDSEGAYPLSIDHNTGGVVDIRYGNLVLTKKMESMIKKQLDEVSDTVIYYENNISHLKLLPRSKNLKVKTFYLPSENDGDKGYRLVIDLFPVGTNVAAEKKPKPYPAQTKNNINKDMAKVSTGEVKEPDSEVQSNNQTGIPGKSEIIIEGTSGGVATGKKSTSSPIQIKNHVKIEKAKISTGEGEKPESENQAKTQTDISGKAEIILRNTNGDRESSKFDEYGDRAQAVTGNIEISRTRENSSEIQVKMKNIGQDDQNLLLSGESYGTVKIEAGYDELPHRYYYGARTLYSGIGTGNLTLDDNLQSNLESTPFTELDNRLSTYFNSAVSGDPAVTRKKGSLRIEWTIFDPVKFNIELKKEKKEGTIPRFGSFGTANTVELLEPVDYDSTQLRLTGEYNKGSLYLSTSYYFSSFENSIKQLSWDNPLVLNDSMFNPSRGLMSLAPDNNYHNLSATGLITILPLRTRISANAALGWMWQNDSLTAYTVNTAVAAPAVPVNNIDGEVRTRLLNVMLTSNPYNSLNFKIRFKGYEYINNTTPIIFPGYVDSDNYFVSTPVANLPSSYWKKTLDTGLRMDLLENTRLALNYTWDKTGRNNREVSEQEDKGLKASLDSAHFTWLYLRASYERINRDVDNYVFDSYLASGEDLTQNPLLRKYDEADMKRDRVHFNADITPWDKLGLSFSYIFGKDDFEHSTYGLMEDRHNIFSVDADYALNKNSNFHVFYTNERYRNITAGNEFTGDWTVTGEDKIQTIGGNLRTRFFSDNLDLDISYSYSKADGVLDFTSNGTEYSSLNNVDDSKFHTLEAEMNYKMGEKWTCSLGYLWEKAVYRDFNKEGFTYVPSDGSDIGFYQGALLMGILPEDYEVNQMYIKFLYYF